MPTLEASYLVKRFGGVAAVDGVSVRFAAAQVVSLIGPNGSGKTTLLNVLSGLLPADSGTFTLDGVTLDGLAPYELAFYGITRTFQEVRLFEQLTVLDNILVVLTERNVFSALFERHGGVHLKQAEEALRRVGLWDKRQQSARQLSYGQRKLLEIARVVAMQAKLVLFDEPFAGLFPEIVATVKQVMRELKGRGATVVLVEHNMDIIRELSDYVYVLDSGQVLAEGSPAEVLARQEVVEAYLGT